MTYSQRIQFSHSFRQTSSDHEEPAARSRNALRQFHHGLLIGTGVGLAFISFASLIMTFF